MCIVVMSDRLLLRWNANNETMSGWNLKIRLKSCMSYSCKDMILMNTNSYIVQRRFRQMLFSSTDRTPPLFPSCFILGNSLVVNERWNSTSPRVIRIEFLVSFSSTFKKFQVRVKVCLRLQWIHLYPHHYVIYVIWSSDESMFFKLYIFPFFILLLVNHQQIIFF